MSETQQSRINNATIINDNATVLVVLLKIVVIIVFVYPLLHYTVLHNNSKGQDLNNETNEDMVVNNTELVMMDRNDEEIHQVIVVKKKKIFVSEPTCSLSYLRVILLELCKDLFIQHEQCTPEDFNNLEKHKVPKPTIAKNNTTGEPRGTIVGCVAAGLLLTSLGAAFIELYKAKSQTPVKTKPPMSRKCSLADLTVLKHNRKELVRRESIMEIPETGGPIKPLGFRPPPLFRRSSFPVGPSEFNQGNPYYSHESRRTSTESRRLSIIDSRRNSIDCRKASIESRKVSIDSRKVSIDSRKVSFDSESSPERRHWSRLVHRH